MIFISYGNMRSASSFAFLLANEVANQSHPRDLIEQQLPICLQPTFIQDISSCIDELIETVPDQQVYVVKTHQHLDRKLYSHLRNGLIMAAVSYRNPYDVLVSLLDAGKKERSIADVSQRRQEFASVFTVEDALSKVPWMLSSNSSWLDQVGILPNLLATPFEVLKNQPQVVTQHYAKMMGITVDASAIANKFLNNRNLIREYNRGQSGRGSNEISVPADHPAKAIMDQYIEKYLQDKADIIYGI